ncbi:MAG: response regulator [Campylobacterales bacterium]|nr:response regulator [Campylobacterales bacterium]
MFKKSKNTVFYLSALLGTFVVGFILLISMHLLFQGFIKKLDEETANQRARKAIGEEITKGLINIRSKFFQLATTTTIGGQHSIKRDIENDIVGIRKLFIVLEQGGTVQQKIILNLVNTTEVISTITYIPPDEEEFILEIIDLKPKILEIEQKVEYLIDLLKDRTEYNRLDKGYEAYVKGKEIKIFLKTAPPLFIRMIENANRMLYESDKKLKELQQEIDDKKYDYNLMEFMVVIGIFFVVIILGVIIARQISRVSSELEVATSEAKELATLADKANTAKGDFLANMSHEIRTPMNGVIGMTELLLTTGLNKEQKEYAETVKYSADSLLTIINDILDFSKIESGKMELEKIEFSLNKCVENTVDLFSGKITEKKLEIIPFIESAVPDIIFGDEVRLRQILVNLIGNAVKFTTEGEIFVKVSLESIQDDEATVLFSVRDTGIGIPADKIETLFESFSQVDASTTRKYGGTGLGLSISKQLSEIMGGEIWIESEFGKGTTFFFTIKTKFVQNSSKRDALHKKATPLSDKKILIGDSNDTSKLVLKRYINSWNGEVLEADNFKDFERKLKESQYDIVVANSNIGEDKLLNTINKKEILKPTMILYHLSHGKYEEIDRGVYQLAKPFKKEQFLNGLIDLVCDNVNNDDGKNIQVSKELLGERYPLEMLLVEDMAINQKLALKMLSNLGFNSDLAENGEVALKKVKEKKYDIIFMDMQMPKMDGLEATKILVETYGSDIRPIIIAMTANAMEGDRETCINAGMDDYLSKPVNNSKLVDMIEKWSSGKRENKTKAKLLADEYPIKILLAEDMLINQKLALKMLEKLGYQVDLAKDGKEALDKAIENQYDLIFMDMQMPKMTGIEATEAILNQRDGKSPIIVAMTANSAEDEKVSCIESGMKDFISKPISYESLEKTIRQWGKQ